MGCGGSKHGDVDLTTLAPRPRQAGTTPNPPTRLTASQLNDCLAQVARYINQRHRKLKFAVIGGAVSTILLQTRNATEDIDILTAASHSRDDARLLSQATSSVRQQNPNLNMEENWLNGNAMLFIQPELRERIIQEAFDQNDVVFDRPGLTLCAAPYTYAIVAKMNRIAGEGGPEHDVGDAAAYLRRYLELRRQPHVTVAQIEGWCTEYRSSITTAGRRNAIEAVRREYLHVYKAPGIVT